MPSLGKKENRLVFHLLKTWVKWALQLYYKSVFVSGKLDKNQGGLLVANHQNTLLDALLLSCFLPGKTYFLTRADVVTPKNKNILEYLGILPIYRIRDGLRQVSKNKVLEEKVKDLIRTGNRVLIFPEGSHTFAHKVGNFKKGYLRFVPEEGCSITPISLSYESFTESGSEVSICIGDAQTKNTQQTPEVLEHIIRNNALHFEDEATFEQTALAFKKTSKRGILAFLSFSKSALYSTPNNDFLSALPLSSSLLNSSIIVKTLVLILTLPLALVGLYYRIIPEALIRLFLHKKIKDHEFRPSVNFALKCFIYPPYLFILCVSKLINHHFLLEGWITILVILMGCKFATQWEFLFKDNLKHIRNYRKNR